MGIGSRKGPHDRTRREDFYALAKLFPVGQSVSDREFGNLVGWDWENNGNKRVKRVAGYLQSLGLAVRRQAPRTREFRIHLTVKALRLGLEGCQQLHRAKVRKLRK